MVDISPSRSDDDALLAIIIICSVVFVMAVIGLTALIWFSKRHRAAIMKKKDTDSATEASWRDSAYDDDADSLEKQDHHYKTPSKLVGLCSGYGRVKDHQQPKPEPAKDMPLQTLPVPSRVLSRPQGRDRRNDRSLYQSPIPSVKSIQNLSDVLSRPNPSFQSSAWEDCSVNMDIFAYSPSIAQCPKGTKTALQHNEVVGIPLKNIHASNISPRNKHAIGLATPLEANADFKQRQ
ncbi:hypothetical protein KEM56_006419 [Ascosphaera pollenicola]|nr:hypothetical protein KEM56_006419 [Ascosphaera pollenicola]